MKRFRAVQIDQAEEGMQLFQDLDDRHGQRLLPAGAVLDAALLRSLRRRDIETLLVRDDSATDELEAQREQLAQRLAHLFRQAGSGQAACGLRAAVEAYRLGEPQ